MKKRIAAIFLTACLMLSVIPVHVGAANSTVEHAYALNDLGLFHGTSSGFSLERQPTRVEGMTMFVRLLGAEEEAKTKNYSHPFTDVPSWGDPYVGYAYQYKYTTGVGNKQFGSTTYVSLEQYVTFILRALGYSDKEGDFTWKTAVSKAQEIGMLSADQVKEMKGAVTTRGTMVDLSWAALTQRFKGGTQTLAESLVEKDVFTREEAIQAGIWPQDAGASPDSFQGQTSDSSQGQTSNSSQGETSGSSQRPASDSSQGPASDSSQGQTSGSSQEQTTAPASGKSFTATTLVRNVNISSADQARYFITMDESSQLIYYDETSKKIFRLNAGTGATEELLDTASAVYRQETDEDGDAAVWRGLTVHQLFYDRVSHQLLVYGTMAWDEDGNGWMPGGSSQEGCSAIFSLSGGKLRFFADDPGYHRFDGTSADFTHICCALSDGTYIVAYKTTIFNSIYLAINDLRSDTMQQELGCDDVYYSVVQNGMDLYRLYSDYAYTGRVEKYNYGSSDWEKTCELPVGPVHYQNNVVYSWSSTEIRATRPNDGATQRKLNPSTDVEVQDLRPIPADPAAFFVTADEQYLFYDLDGKAIRVLKANS